MADFTRIYSSFTPGTAKPVLSPWIDKPDDSLIDETPAPGSWYLDLFSRARELFDENGEIIYDHPDPATHDRICRAITFNY